MASCQQCGQDTDWDDDLGTAVCTICGTLADPSQSALVSHLDQHDNSARQYDNLPIPTSSTLRSRQGWHLPGQGKSARDMKNNYTMHEFIRSISSNLSAPGVSTRATTLFSQAMVAGRYRWGRKAKLTAAASVAVAMREAHRSDSLRDIAYLIDEPPLALCRAFVSLSTLLKVSLTSSDPAMHFPAIRNHLASHLPPSSSALSRSVIAYLEPLSLTCVIRTSHALSRLISRMGNPSLLSLPTAPTACALVILGLEAEARTSAPDLSDLAQDIGDRLAAGKRAVLSRYRLLVDLVEGWTREVPWLDHFTSKNGRSKLSKRVIVARGLKDVLQFQQDIWHKKLHTVPRPAISSEDMDEDQSDADTNTVADQEMAEQTGPPRKKKKLSNELIRASHFLLDPSSAPSSGSNNLITQSSLSMASFLLNAADSALYQCNAPTRLQRIAAERGGEGEIDDEELFDDGEWDAMIRPQEEQAALRALLTWDSNATDSDMQASSASDTRSAPQRARDEGTCTNRTQRHRHTNVHTSGRINAEAYSRLLLDLQTHQSDGLLYANLDLSPESSSDPEDERSLPFPEGDFPQGDDVAPAVERNEALECWRPLSPDHCCHDRYHEEY